MQANHSWDLRSTSFAAALLDPDIDIPAGVGRDGEEKSKRFSVYRNNVVVSLIDAMKASFPAVLGLLGEENFILVARNYISQSPPQSPMMQNYGTTFPDFLEGFPPLAQSPFLADLARLERHWLDSYHAIDATVLSGDDFAGLEPEQTLGLRFVANPAARLFNSRYPVFDLYGAKDEFPDMESLDINSGQCVLIVRINLSVDVILLEPPIAAFIDLLFRGETLAEAIGEAMEIEPTFAAGSAIAFMLEHSIFSKIQTAGS